MIRNKQVARAVHHALILGAVGAASAAMPAFAQEQESENVDTVIVTGSRIAQPNLTTTSPVTQVTAQDVATAGVTRIEDLVNQLPQAFAAQNATVSNGSTGTATVDLRGLGSPRTLVLVDGRRMPYGGVTNSAADLNQIPTIMVERVEILTGGASAVYGSDAVSGVVNFIMKKNFTGVQIDGQYNFYQHHNGYGGPGPSGLKLRDQLEFRHNSNPSQFNLPDSNVTDGYGRQGSIMIGVGTEDGRGNITAYATIRKDEAVLQGNRDYSACSLATAAPLTAWGNADFSTATSPGRGCGGSGTAYPGTFTDFSNYNFTVDSASGNTFRPFVGATDQYNFGPLNHYLRPDKYYSFGALGHYELNDHADVYTELMFTDYRSIAQIAPGGAFFDTSTINCDNPLLSASQATDVGCSAAAIANTDIDASTRVPLYIGRRNVEGGGRQQDFHNAAFRGVAGVRGSISQDWSYDISGQFSRVTADQITNNYFSIRKLNRALDAVGYTKDVNGNIVALPAPACRSTLDGTDKNCIPYNPFAIGGVTPAALGYVQTPGVQTGVIDQEVLTATVTGDLGGIGGQLPTAAEPIKLAFGAEYRRDKLGNVTDDELASADLSGTGGATISISGSTHVTDLFMEGRVPLVQDKPGMHDIAIDVAYRYSDYGSNLTTDTYKVGGDWAPTTDIRFRASFQRAVRAANIVELFTARGFNLFDQSDDPCGATGRPDIPVTAAQCLNSTAVGAVQGAPALTSPAGQYNFLQGGEPALTPEKSDTTSFGVILTPRFAPGLSVTLDYFDIKIDNTISTYGADNILKACYVANDPVYCALINRNPGNGSLWIGDGHVVDLNVNIGSKKTTGVDVNINYAGLDLGGAGKFSFNVTGTYVEKLQTDPLPGIVAAYDCTGFFTGSCLAPAAKWRHHARIGWQTPWKGLDLALTWRYIGSTKMFGGNPARIDYKFPSFNYFDLAADWTVMEKVDIRLGINNITDKDPPLNATVGTTGNGNTYPQTYEALGRYIFGGVTVKF